MKQVRAPSHNVGTLYKTYIYLYIPQIHQRSALRLRRMCSLNGGLFVKVGQHIGSLEYLLPAEYVNTFKVFHSSAPSTPVHRMKQVIKEEFGVPGKYCECNDHF